MENDPANDEPPVAQVQIPEAQALGEAQGPPPAQALLGLNLIPPPATVTAPMNSMKDVSAWKGPERQDKL